MEQQARNITMEEWGSLRGCCYLLHDRYAKFCPSFRELIKTGSVNPLRLPARSPNLKDYASHCTSCVRCDTTSLARRRCDSFTLWAFRGGLLPGCSYIQSFLWLEGGPHYSPRAVHILTHCGGVLGQLASSVTVSAHRFGRLP